MTITIRWIGDHDGAIELTRDGATRTIDRPGDAVLVLQELLDARVPGIGAFTAYAVCLGLRGVAETHFVRQILEKTIPFVAGADPASRIIYEVSTRLRKVLAEDGLEGADLRTRIHVEAARIHEEELPIRDEE